MRLLVLLTGFRVPPDAHNVAARAAMHPNVPLFDEPTSVLDPELVRGVLDATRDL